MANKTPRTLPSLEDFRSVDLAAERAETPDRFGNFVIERRNSQGDEINIEASIGWLRPTGPERRRRERTTLHIGWISVTEGRHLGAAALNLAIQHAQANAKRGIELHAGRMQISHPGMVHAVEKLRDIGIVKEALYLEDDNTAPHALPPTKGFEKLPNLVTAAEAASYLEVQDVRQARGAVPEELGTVCCKFTF